MKKAISIPSELKKVGSIFSDAGYKAYLVGGAVRDALLGKPVHDWDLATNATPQQVMKLFRKVIPTGIAHGTVTVRIFNRSIEVTTFRTESTYSDGRHPDAVAYAATIEEDLSRRDFTMNAIAADLTDGTLADPFDGQADIQHKIIRTVGNPYDRFAEDGLRPVRAVRFAGQLGFTIEEQTLKALSDAEVLKKTDSISRERFRDEWCKMLLTPKPSLCIKLLEQTGILNLFIPQFTACRGSEQKDSRGYHVFDVADHLIYATDGAPQDNLIVRLAAFYHDIAKPQCRSIEQQGEAFAIHFYGHETAGEKIARTSMTDLKFSNEQINAVALLVREHMFYYESSWKDATVRRFIIRVGKENIENLLLLRIADMYGKNNCMPDARSDGMLSIYELRERTAEVEAQHSALSIKDLAVNGKDLMQIGIPAGKTMGAILKELFETVTESPAMNEKEKLLTLAQNIFAQKYTS
ncbi:MAG: HD domain-containing protein [Treponema sp.]|nr:HD domain-containing protein [Treponema sp.]